MPCGTGRTGAEQRLPPKLKKCSKILQVQLEKSNRKRDKYRNDEEIDAQHRLRVKNCGDSLIAAIIAILKEEGVEAELQEIKEKFDKCSEELAGIDSRKKDIEEYNERLKKELDEAKVEIKSKDSRKKDIEEYNERLKEELDEAKAKIKRLAEQKDKLQEQIEETQRRHAEELENRNQLKNEESTKFKETITVLESRAISEREAQEDKITKLTDDLNTSKSKVESLQREVQSKEDENTALKVQYDEQTEIQRRQYEQYKAQSNQYIQNLCLQHQQREEQLQQSIDNVQRQLQKQEAQSRQTIDHLQSNVVAERKAKEDALTRLSAAAASKLRDKNPGITDLSDPNRPLKLSEKMSELYDNEWTNAMEKLEDLEIDENKGIEIMLDIVTTLFDHFRHLGQRQLENISKVVVVPDFDERMNEENDLYKIPELPIEILKPLKDFRKANADIAIQRFQQTFAKDCLADKVDSKCLESCTEYIASCTELVWLMQVQDPPVHIEWGINPDDDFDTNTMRSYTKSGKYVDYVVWPILYLHKGGPLLCKGVVQGKKTKKTKVEAQAEGQNKTFDDGEPASKNTNTETEVDGTNIQNGNDIHDQNNHTDPSKSSQMNHVEPPRFNGSESTAAQTNEANHASEDSQGENDSKSDSSFSSNGDKKEDESSNPIPHSTEAAEPNYKEREESPEEESESSHSLNEEKDGDTPSDTSTTHEAATGTTAGETCEEGRERSMPHSTEAAEPSSKEREESPEKESESSHSLNEEKDGDTPSDTSTTHEAATGTTAGETCEEGRERSMPHSTEAAEPSNKEREESPEEESESSHSLNEEKDGDTLSDTPPLTHEAATGPTADEAYEEGRERTKSSGQSSQGSDNREYFDAVDKPYEQEEKYSDCHSDVPCITDSKNTNFEEEFD